MPQCTMKNEFLAISARPPAAHLCHLPHLRTLPSDLRAPPIQLSAFSISAFSPRPAASHPGEAPNPSLTSYPLPNPRSAENHLAAHAD